MFVVEFWIRDKKVYQEEVHEEDEMSLNELATLRIAIDRVNEYEDNDGVWLDENSHIVIRKVANAG